jgi:hypothetical protein
MWVAMAGDCGAAILRHGWIKMRAGLAVTVLASAALISLITVPRAWGLLDAVLFRKGTSLSALHRTATFGRGVQVFQHSWGLGAGLGSNRAMSVFFYILSNLGIPGMLLAFLLFSQLYSQVRLTLCRPNTDPAYRGFLIALGGAFVADVVALLVSGAEISQPRLWILWGLLLATIRCAWLAERQSMIVSSSGDNRRVPSPRLQSYESV